MPETTDVRPLVLLEDEAVPGHLIDELGMTSFASVIAATAVGTGGPFTIGAFATWGLGKTSVLRQAKSLIEDDPKHGEVVTVWFNAWQYEKEDHPIVPLVATIVREIERKDEELHRAGNLVKEGWRKTVTALRAIAYGFSAKAKASVPGFGDLEAGFVAKEMIDRYDKLMSTRDPLLEQSLYYNAFEALEKATKDTKDHPKIVVFIDDLDRCLPNKALRLLESLKLVLAQPGFIFVLAVDPVVIEGFLEKRYKEKFGIESYATSGASYLQKIVQLPLWLPPHQSRFKAYVEGLLKRPALEGADELRATLTDIAEVLAVGANYNPRGLVRFINNLLVDARLWELKGEKVDAALMSGCAVSRILQEHLGEYYRLLLRDPELCAMLLEPNDGGWDIKRKQERDTTADRREIVIKRIEQRSFLLELLTQTEAGKGWLTDKSLREKVDGFLESQRSSGDLRTQKQIFDDAIAVELVGQPPTPDNLGRIKALVFNYSGITDIGLQQLTPLAGLQTIWLNGTQITDAGLEYLIAFKELRELLLGQTQVTDNGLQHLSALTGLKKLSLNGTQITDAGLQHLSAIKSLDTLSLNVTSITDVGLQQLATLVRLTKLSLDGTKITDTGLKHLKALSGLRELSLNGTMVTNEGMQHLAALNRLKQLSVENTNVDVDATSKLLRRVQVSGPPTVAAQAIET